MIYSIVNKDIIIIVIQVNKWQRFGQFKGQLAIIPAIQYGSTHSLCL